MDQRGQTGIIGAIAVLLFGLLLLDALDCLLKTGLDDVLAEYDVDPSTVRDCLRSRNSEFDRVSDSGIEEG